MVLLEAIVIGGIVKNKNIKLPEPLLSMKNDLMFAIKQNAKEFVKWI